MNNLIDRVIAKNKNLKLMTHIVAGYPDIKTNMEVIKVMADSGVDLIEIQIPFSDPVADGPTIMRANSCALNNFHIDDFFNLVEHLKKEINIPLLVMTYANIPFNFGMERFIERSANSGLSGLIIPDLPFDEENENYIQTAQRYNMHAIQVVSPGIDEKRLNKILNISSGFVYATLKVGITGATKEINKKGLDFPEIIKSHTALPVAAGFGISSPEQLDILKNKIDIAIIGSCIIDVFENTGLKGVRDFVKECRVICESK